MKGFVTIGLLILSNVFMTLAWYGHLKFKELKWFENAGLITVVLISWGLALFEYFFQVPANKIGYEGNGGRQRSGHLRSKQAASRHRKTFVN